MIASKHDGMIKVITGVRRCGKSFLLFNLFVEHLRDAGVDDKHIIMVDLESRRNKSLRDPDALLEYIDGKIKDGKMHYVLLDEIQYVAEFEDVLNSYLKMRNVDVYVTGSNSKLLSKDVITEFRGRGHEIKVAPLSFREFMSARTGDRYALLEEYLTYGGLPQVVCTESIDGKKEYLRSLFANVYMRDIKERYGIQRDGDLEELIDVVASSIGSLTNPSKIEHTFRSVKNSHISNDTIKTYLDLLEDAFLIEKAVRYDIKGRKYIDTPLKYYFEDLGLRNARLNFRQVEFTHLMENCIFNELRMRGMSVDVGQVNITRTGDNGKQQRSSLEVDFVCNVGYKRYYIQSAYALPTQDKIEQEYNSLRRIKDGFPKYVIQGTPSAKYMNEDGITIMNVFEFLMDENSLDG